MSKCENHASSKHINAFVDLNGVPYLLAEYLDKRPYQQIDRSVIKSEILVDQSESMRAIIDINIDDIGRKASNGLLAIRGNKTKQKDLLRMIKSFRDSFDNQLQTLKRGIVIRVNYKLEDQTTGRVIRSAGEDFELLDRSYFIDINPEDINDNGVIVNFSNTFVSTVTEFTHGTNRMRLRITNIQLLYRCVKNSPKMPRIKQSLTTGSIDRLPTEYGDEMDYYQYHKQMQHHHQIGTPGDCGCDDEEIGYISAPTWSSFNRFYHFDNSRRDIVIHHQEVNDPMNKYVLIPCGTVSVNRTFMINPGHRLIFKFSIWKNDVTIVGDTSVIADTLRVQCPDEYHDCGCNDHDDNNHTINPDYESVIRLLKETRANQHKQACMINRLIDKLEELEEMIKIPPVIDPSDPLDPGTELPPPTHGCGCHGEHDEISKKIEELETELDDLKDSSGCDCEEILPIPEDVIRSMVNESFDLST